MIRNFRLLTTVSSERRLHGTLYKVTARVLPQDDEVLLTDLCGRMRTHAEATALNTGALLKDHRDAALKLAIRATEKIQRHENAWGPTLAWIPKIQLTMLRCDDDESAFRHWEVQLDPGRGEGFGMFP